MKMGWLELLQPCCDHEATDSDTYTEEGPAGERERDAARAPAATTHRSQPRCAACVLGHGASLPLSPDEMEVLPHATNSRK